MTFLQRTASRPSGTWPRIFRCCVHAAILVGAAAHAFEPEQLQSGKSLPADMPRVYVSDFSIAHLPDGRVYVLDGRNGRRVGTVDAGYAGQFTVSSDGKELYVAATYMTRHTHGERSDVVEVYDADNLRLKADVILPPRRAQAAFLKGLLRTSADGKFLFVQNATPATSVSVVDLVQKKLLAEVSTPGCWGIYPSATEALRFSALCGDGKMATITLDDTGKVTKRAVTPKFFDSDKAPLFVQAEQLDGRLYFVSFTGTLLRVDVRGEQAVVEQTQSFVSSADAKKSWRPGGYQIQALDVQRRRLFVGMHANGEEGSHKRPAEELWAIDIDSGKRVVRMKSANAIAISIGAQADRLYALNGASNELVAYDLKTRKRVFVSEPLGGAPLQVHTP